MSILPSPLTYFPYPTVRKYQDDFINVIYDSARNREHIAVAAASGLGKTIGVLSAALPLAKESDLKILYVARTHKECDRAIEELKVIDRPSTKVSGISIRGRSEACFNKLVSKYTLDAATAMEVCSELKKRHSCRFFERLRSRKKDVEEEIKKTLEGPMLFGEVVERCKKAGICAYELAKLVVGKVDVAAMSYNYLLHDEIRQTLLKSFEHPLSSYILIMDEAHNLPDAAANLASDRLSASTLKWAESEAVKHGLPMAYQFLVDVGRAVETIQEYNGQEEVAIPCSILIDRIAREHGIEPKEVENLLIELHRQGESIKRSLIEGGRLPRSSIHHIAQFLLRWLETSDRASYLHLLSTGRGNGNTGEGKVRSLEIVCLDPSEVSSNVLSEVYSSISMSGTLEPLDCYIDVMGLPNNTRRYVFDSPFLKENIKIVICRGVGTSLSERSPAMYRRLAARIVEAVSSTPTNTGVFAASYDVLHGLIEADLEGLLTKPLFVESPDSSSSRNDALIDLFRKSASCGGGVLLGVQGGRNSEGLDLPGDLLNTVIVVGVPYAKPTPRVEAGIDYYERKFPKKGKEYAYNIPAVRKAAQAAGRAFRSIDDRGAVVFLDRRFGQLPCVRLLPSWISKSYKVLPDEDGVVSRELKSFYDLHRTSKD